MTVILYFLPMPRVLLLAFDGAQTLDLLGPAEVFAMAARLSGTRAYEVLAVTSDGRTIRTSSGIRTETISIAEAGLEPSDTVLAVGGDEAPLVAALADRELVGFLTRAATEARRVGSICSGAFLLAATGALDGHRAATHWASCDRLAAFRPSVEVDREAIFVKEGRVWTSAGVTTGLDMALAMVEEDLGRPLADSVAARLVLYVRRPGHQSQFSEALVAQTEGSDPLGAAIVWARANLRTLDVPRLAKRAGLSVRTLHRRSLELVGTTPAKLIERLRVEHARALLAKRGRSAKVVAAQCGFGSPDRMRRAFARVLGMGPREYLLLFGD